jgi:hypothetical protein
VTFAPGDTRETVQVPIVDDELDEEDEMVLLTLSDAENATLGEIHSATLTLLDDDEEAGVSIYLPLMLRNYPP